MAIKILVGLCCFLEVSAALEKRFLIDDIQKHCQHCFDCQCNHHQHSDCQKIFGYDSCAICKTDCQHNEATTAPNVSLRTSATTAPNVSLRTSATTAPNVSLRTSTCDKVGVIDAIARNEAVSHPVASPCGSDPVHREQDYALILRFCNTTADHKQWKSGNKVIDIGDEHCSTPEHSYIPVLTSINGHQYNAVMIACSKQEIKVVYQDCTHSPKIWHITKDTHEVSMYNFYVLTWP